ncbi:propanediol utilization protein [Vulcanibacillus modesticaldus]|uniref:Phosphate propanoyltransferase n=1 Tax=Vulcanibacillus modesticaldus TaxID=337097 RepID=A0A1D2YXH2_9BACI|nr:phosphate propanoyltransferase [Vulcanibacillus modesticaldus]OEG00481.1 propanediol utilization protein [Vulcanibacillus modesticaldus]
MRVPVGISNRHIHLSRNDLDALFGEGYELNILKDLSQPGQYASKEVVTIVGPKGKIENVRILGPVRRETQVEISRTDSFALGVKPPVRDSGLLVDTPGVKIIGPKGEVELEKGVILAARHIHFHTSDAKEFGVKDQDRVRVQVGGERGVIFENVLARVSENYALEFHVDTDEANAAGLKNGDEVEVLYYEN